MAKEKLLEAHKLMNVCNGLHIHSAIKDTAYSQGVGGMLSRMNGATEEDFLRLMYFENGETKAILVVQTNQTTLQELLKSMASRPDKWTHDEGGHKLSQLFRKIHKEIYPDGSAHHCFLKAYELGEWRPGASTLWKIHLIGAQGTL